MSLAYVPPGVTVRELVTPSAASILVTPNNLCLVGLTQGFIQRTDQLTLVGTTAVALPNLPSGATLSAVVSVANANAPTVYTVTTDYTVQAGAGTVTRVGAGAIADGAVVNVVYQYLPSDYWLATRLDSFGAVQNRYGAAYDSSGNVSTPLSFAAMMAFENGAPTVVCQPLFVRATPGDPTTLQSQPNATQAAASTTWADSLYPLRDIQDVNIIVPVIGQSSANVTDSAWVAAVGTVQDHIEFMKQQNQYLQGIFGEDSSGANTVGQMATIRSHAGTLQSRQSGDVNENIVLLSPSKFSRVNGLGVNIFIGGQYVAGAIGGMLTGQNISQTLTRKQISGLAGVNDYRSKSDKNADAQAGLLVIEQRNLATIIRHAITLDTTSVAHAELSVVRQKFFMITSLQETLDTNVVGQIVADGNALAVISSAITGVLEGLKSQRAIVNYTAIDARFLTLNPTTVEVRFSYLPSFPVNYINVSFSIDLSGAVLTGSTLTSQV